MNLTGTPAEGAAGASVLTAAEEGAGTGTPAPPVMQAGAAASSTGVTFAQLQQLLNQQADVNSRLMRELQEDMQGQISGAIDRLEDRSYDQSAEIGRRRRRQRGRRGCAPSMMR